MPAYIARKSLSERNMKWMPIDFQRTCEFFGTEDEYETANVPHWTSNQSSPPQATHNSATSHWPSTLKIHYTRHIFTQTKQNTHLHQQLSDVNIAIPEELKLASQSQAIKVPRLATAAAAAAASTKDAASVPGVMGTSLCVPWCVYLFSLSIGEYSTYYLRCMYTL